MMHDPRVLIVSSYAPPMVGGPHVLHTLFSSLPNIHHAVVTSYSQIQEDIHDGVRGQWLSGKYYFYDHPGSDRPAPSAPTDSKTLNNAVPLIARIRIWLQKLPLVGQSLLDILTFAWYLPKYVGAVRRAVLEEQATVLYGVSDKGLAMLATFIVHRQTRLPYIIHMFDLYVGNNLSPVNRIIARCFEGMILRGAQTVVVTNEGTAQYYQQRYGASIRLVIIHNPVHAESYASTQGEYAPEPPFKIIFTGNIGWPQEQSVLNLLSALEQLHDLPIELHLYTPHQTARITSAIVDKPYIHRLTAPATEMPAIQKSATLLFLPLAWDTNSPAIIATATPGKFTDYLASGRPMLVHAPEYAYVSIYTKQHSCGLVVDQNDSKKLADAIRGFLQNPTTQGAEYARRAREIFLLNHTTDVGAKKLQNILTPFSPRLE